MPSELECRIAQGVRDAVARAGRQAETFMELCLRGIVRDPDATVEDWIGVWHASDDDRPLDRFLGMTEAEYAAWVELHKTVADIVRERRA